jgi:hypothetical protein
MSVHERDHGALDMLRSYPLWTPPPEKMTADLLAESFVATARTVLSATEVQREAALVHASPYQRRVQMAPAVRDLVESLGDPRALADRDEGNATKASVQT